MRIIIPVLLAVIPTMAWSLSVSVPDTDQPSKNSTDTAKQSKSQQKKQQQGSWQNTSVSFGAVINTGNTESKNFNSKAQLGYKVARWLYTGEGSYQRNSTASDGVTAEKLYLEGMARYNFTAHDFYYTQANYTDDKFDSYDYVLNLNIGYGRNLAFVPNNMSLSIFVGPGLQRRMVRDANKPTDKPNLQLGINYSWQINSNVQFSQDVQTEATSDNIRTKFDSSLSTKLLDDISFQLHYQATYDTKPQQDKKSWNTTTTLNLVYTFA